MRASHPCAHRPVWGAQSPITNYRGARGREHGPNAQGPYLPPTEDVPPEQGPHILVLFWAIWKKQQSRTHTASDQPPEATVDLLGGQTLNKASVPGNRD